jgi:hypothetical protein
MNTTARLAGLMACAALTATLAACGTARTPAPAPPPAAAAAATTTPASTPSQDALAWWNGGGKANTLAVQADLTAYARDASAADISAANADAAQLLRDTVTADADPMPATVDTGGYYQDAMHQFALAAGDSLAGDYAGASAALTAGTTALGKATAEVNALTS